MLLLDLKTLKQQLKEYQSDLTIAVDVALEFLIDSSAIFALKRCRAPPSVNSKFLNWLEVFLWNMK